jgi:hypothetical protein
MIAGANGLQMLTVPIEKADSGNICSRDVRISNHGHWRHTHWQALVSAYGLSPFFEYYQDDLAPFYERSYIYLLDFNESLRELLCGWIELYPDIRFTPSYRRTVRNDFRDMIRPRHPGVDSTFTPLPYYQVFRDRHGFLPNLSIIDLIFNMGPESLLVLQKSRTVCNTELINLSFG